jgi:hypothetical protein
MKDNTGWGIHAEFVILMITLIGGFYLLGSRIDATNYRLDQHMDSTNTRFDQFMLAWKEESTGFHEAMKDFHGRLCSIEERNKGK